MRRRNPAMRERFPAIAGILLLLVLLGLLEWAVRAGAVSPFAAPPPSEVWKAGIMLFREERLAQAFLLTLGLVFAATLAAAAAGLAAGWLLYRHTALGRAYESWLAALFSAPLILFYPLFLVLFGRTLLTIVVIGFLAGVIPIIMKSREGLIAVPQVLVNVARSFKMRERDIFFKVLLPSALPTIFTGLRLGFIYATINVVAIEYLANFGGLGFMVGEMYDRFDIPAMYASVVFVIAVSVVGFYAAEKIERSLRSA
ncbi:MAG: ABC transporter permease subunit [Burkholderiales bacterium]